MNSAILAAIETDLPVHERQMRALWDEMRTLEIEMEPQLKRMEALRHEWAVLDWQVAYMRELKQKHEAQLKTS